MANILLWLDTLITTDEPGQASICAFLFEARQWLRGVLGDLRPIR
jgi:hypothetical protein